MAPLIGERAAWSDDAMRQRQLMWCAILLSCCPSLIPASRPCLYVTAVVPAVSHSNRTVCSVCVYLCKSLCAHVCCCFDKSIQTPASLPALVVMAEVKGEGAGSFERLPSFPSIQPSSTNCSTAQLTSSLRQTEWIKGDTMRHLMEQSRSPTAPVPLYTTLPSSPGSEESTSRAKQRVLKYTIFTKMTCQLPQAQNPPPCSLPFPHLSDDISSTSLALLMLYPFWLLAFVSDRAEEITYRGREWKGICICDFSLADFYCFLVDRNGSHMD